MTMTSKFP